jgi:hypothetical protein
MSAYTDHEARLRAALHAAADSLEPRGDGLERIRTRLRQPKPAYLARLQAVYAEIIMRAPAWLQDVVYQVAEWLRVVSERFAPAQTPGKHRSRTQGLLRPAAAMAVVMFIVAAGTYVAIETSTAIFPSSSNSQPGGGQAGHSGAPGPGGSHASGTQSAAGSGSRPAASPTCKPTSPKPAASPAPPPASPSASPSPADTSTSPDPSASPADTTSDSPPASAAPSAAPPPPATTSPSPGLVPKPSPSC